MTEVDIQPLNPAGLPASTNNYTHGTLVTGGSRTVFVSGQVPWGDEAGMGVRNLAKATTYLSDRRYREANSRIRAEVLGDVVAAGTS